MGQLSSRNTSVFQDKNKQAEEKGKKNLKVGEMDPDLCNQVQAPAHYYRNASQGIVYQNLKEEKQREELYNNFGIVDTKYDSLYISRPIKKIYINFDKDIAHRMFGYRVRFDAEKMLMYMGTGRPGTQAQQTHKPIHYYIKDHIGGVLD